ncbi:MAG: glycoside hydrolase family 27 protein [Burkholderiales bacterium]|nr:glycoside hydrolase family 27 protein [Phycisphaerae bacterium]
MANESITALADAKPHHEWALTPPMGWNSWDCFGTAVTEAQTKENADYMAEKLLKHGWNLITVDIQWYEPNAKGHDYVEGAPVLMDEHGRLLPAVNKFPSSAGGNGFKPLADYVHGKGLQFGIHLMRGIPRQAVRENKPILGTDVRARDIANTNDICKWNPDMYGVDMTKPGAQAYYDSVFALIASWGVDFVKVDDLSRPYHDHKPEIEAIRKAIDKTGRKMVLSTSPGETPLDAGEHVTRHANLWRISDDFWDNWKLLYEQFERCKNWAKFAGPGHWPDADMLALGAVRVGQRDPWTKFTPDEQVTHMTLWIIARSPLIFGGHLPRNDAWTLSLLTNDEVIAVNQHGTNQHEVSNDNGLIAWASDAPDSRDKYVAVFNTRKLENVKDTDGVPVVVKLDRIGIAGAAKVRDLWTKSELGEFTGEMALPVRSHGARLLRVSPK